MCFSVTIYECHAGSLILSYRCMSGGGVCMREREREREAPCT